MISFISRFRVFVVAGLLIASTELGLALYGQGSQVYKDNFLELAFYKAVSPQKFVIMKKIQDLAQQDAEYVSIGDSTGLFGLQPSIIDQYLNGKKYINFSTAADAGYEGYRYLGEYYLKRHKKGKTLLVTLSPFILPADYAGRPMARSIRDNYINHWRHILLPSFAWRLKLTNLLFYNHTKDEPYAYHEGHTTSYPPLSVWDGQIRQNRGWLDFPVRLLMRREDCSFRKKNDTYDKSFNKELNKFIPLGEKHDARLVILFSPVSCVDAGHHSDYLQIQLDRFAFKNRDVFIPFGLLTTWSLENFGDNIHLKPEPSARYSHLVGKVLAEWERGERQNYYGDSFEKMTGDELHGEVRTYYVDGELNTVRNYKNGKPEGVSDTYYQSGALRATRTYVNGVLEGDVKSFYPDGQLEYSVPFEKGKESGRAYRYSTNGKLVNAIDYEDGFQQGKYISYDDDGRKMMELTVVNGKANGLGYHYYPNGNVKMKVNYSLNKMHGVAEFYAPTGQLVGTKKYSRGAVKG